MKKIIFNLIMMFLLLLPITLAQNTSNICIDANTLLKTTSLVLNGNPLVVQENETCTFGCDDVNNSCKQDPFLINLGAIIGVFALIASLVWVKKRLG
jgi:hypothetical protein